MPRRSARLIIPIQAFALKEYFGCGESSKICDKCDSTAALGDSPKLCIEYSPRNAPPSIHVIEAPGCGPSFCRHMNSGGLRLCDPDAFLDDGSEVLSFVGAKGSGHIFPDHESGPDVCASSSVLLIGFSHLLNDSDLFHKKPRTGVFHLRATDGTQAYIVLAGNSYTALGAFSTHALPFSSYAQVLAGATANDHIDGRHLCAFEPGNIA